MTQYSEYIHYQLIPGQLNIKKIKMNEKSIQIFGFTPLVSTFKGKL